MKIGILTFHYPWNYGAVLQTMATVHFLESLGHEPVVLDYRNKRVARGSRAFVWDGTRFRNNRLSYLIKFIPSGFKRMRRGAAFRRFRRNNLPLKPFREPVDAYLIGSDQVWNTRLTGGPDPVYTGEALPSGKPVIAWAASAGKTGLTPDMAKRIRAHFTAYSVREQTMAEWLPGSMVLPDPTLLLTAEQWRSLIRPYNGKPFVLAYPMIREEEVMDAARWKAGKSDLPLRVLTSRTSLGHGRRGITPPSECLTLLSGADYIVTSSFHGAAFAKLFDKPLTLVSDPIDPRFDALNIDLEAGRAAAASFLENALKG